MSIPFLTHLIDSQREVEEGVYHVTEILNPPQVVYLSRNMNNFADPYSMVWAMLGTGVHGILAGVGEKLGDRYEIEKNFIVDFGYAKLSGTTDLWDKDEKVLWDYKTIKSYAVKKLLAGDWSGSKYADQLNIYAAYGYPEAKRLVIEAVVKDWSPSIQLKDGIRPIEDINVPMHPQGCTEMMVQALLQEHVRVQKEGGPRPCTDEEIWITTNPRSPNCGIPLRCRDYCPASSVCLQYQRRLELEGKHAAPKRAT
jgi:hypothetical protein